MPKAYWVVTYRSVSDPQKLAAYAKAAVSNRSKQLFIR
jgi:hypothetical protein